MRVALILTGHVDGAAVSFPHYLQQIKHSTVATQVDIFASVHSDTGQTVQNISQFSDCFTDSKTFNVHDHRLPEIHSRGHVSIAEFAAAVTHWQDQLLNYDMVWRGRWDSYLQGNSALLDALLHECWHQGGSSVKIDHMRHRVLSRSLCVNYGRPAMEGKHHWATAHTVVAAFDNWQTRWMDWINRVGRFRFDAHLTWAETYASIGANILNGQYTVQKVHDESDHVLHTDTVSRDIKMLPDVPGQYPPHYRPRYSDDAVLSVVPMHSAAELNQQHQIQSKIAVRLRRNARRQQLAEQIRSQNPH